MCECTIIQGINILSMQTENKNISPIFLSNDVWNSEFETKLEFENLSNINPNLFHGERKKWDNFLKMPKIRRTAKRVLFEYTITIIDKHDSERYRYHGIGRE